MIDHKAECAPDECQCQTGVKIHVACPVCGQTITYVHKEADAWGSLSLTDTGVVEITGHDRGIIAEHMRPHHEDGSFREAHGRRMGIYAAIHAKHFATKG